MRSGSKLIRNLESPVQWMCRIIILAFPTSLFDFRDEIILISRRLQLNRKLYTELCFQTFIIFIKFKERPYLAALQWRFQMLKGPGNPPVK